MQLQLKRPLIFFDIESTGLRIESDRIVEISLVKVFPDGHHEVKTRRINPEMPIPPESTAVHGITDEDVKNEPTFKQVAKSLAQMIVGCDIAGYNSNRFDVPLLAEEFYRAGVEVDFSKMRFIDVQVVFHKMEPRTLEAAYKFYCNQNLVDAHSAEADTLATYEVLKAQLDRYPDALENSVDFLANFTQQQHNVELAGRLVYNEKEEPVINFGKYKGKSLYEVFASDMGYYDWVMNANFTEDTKHHFSRLYYQYRQEKR